MTTLRAFMYVLSIIAVVAFVTLIAYLEKDITQSANIEAPILSISSTPDQDGLYVVGVLIELANKKYLIDVQLSHAEAAYYKSHTKLPLQIVVTIGHCDSTCLRAFLNERQVWFFRLSQEDAQYILNSLQ